MESKQFKPSNSVQLSRFSKMLFSLLSVLFITAVAASEQPPQLNQDFKVGIEAPDFTLPDPQGKLHKLSDQKGSLVVLEWFNKKCPFVKKYYASDKEYQDLNMPALQGKYTGQGVKWFTIVSSAPGKSGHMSPAEHSQTIKEWGLKSTAFLIDETSTVAASYRAKTTPYLVVVDPSGKVAYAGAIDDQPTTEPQDLKKAKSYLSQALDELLANKPVSLPETESYGCSVKY